MTVTANIKLNLLSDIARSEALTAKFYAEHRHSVGHRILLSSATCVILRFALFSLLF